MRLPIHCFVVAFTGISLAADMALPPVSVRALPSGAYELTVTVQDTTDVGIAQQALVPEARKVCGGPQFTFGHYEFRSSEQATHNSAPAPSPSVTLKQELRCGPAGAAATPRTSYEWTPSDADTRLVAARTEEYLAHKDKGELSLAYGQFSDSMRAATPYDTWRQGVKDFLAKAGTVAFRRIEKVSWVKDPPGADPGFYAAVDYSGQFQNFPHECGYLAWYREQSGQLTIVREEEGYIDRETERRLTPDKLQEMLAKIGCVGPPPSPLPESKDSTIGYRTVAEALAALRQMNGVSFSTVRGWTIATDEVHLTVWSFSPKSDPSYPAVVRRRVTSDAKGSNISMDILCEADKSSCDNLVREFNGLNSRATGAQPETQ